MSKVNGDEVGRHGWGTPLNSKKHHYFNDARSLCMKWLFTGAVFEDTGGEAPRAEDCKECWRRSRPLVRK